MEDNAVIFEKAARCLFGDGPNPEREMGKAVARITYRGIFQVFLRVPTREYVINWALHLWKAYFDHGDAGIENYREPNACFVVRNFPELPLSLREVIAGHLEVILEETGARDIQVVVPTDHPQAWVWRMSWT